MNGKLLAIGLILLTAVATSHAGVVNWKAGVVGAFDDTNNWVGGALPTVTDVAAVPNGGTITINGTASYGKLQMYSDVGADLGYVYIADGGVLNCVSTWGTLAIIGSSYRQQVFLQAGGTWNIGAPGGAAAGGGWLGDAGNRTHSGLFQSGGTLNAINMTKTVGMYGPQQWHGLVIGMREGGFYELTGGVANLSGTELTVGGTETVDANFLVGGTGPTSIDMAGMYIRGASRMTAQIDAGGITLTDITGNVNFSAGSQIVVEDIGAVAGTYRIMEWDGTRTGTPTVVLPTADWSYNLVDGGSGYLEVTLVPEPATMTLIGLGGLALLRRRL